MKALIEKHYWLFLSVILVFAFVTRVYRVAEIKDYIFDEVYHAVTAKLVARNNPMAYEWWNEPPEPNTAIEWLHPPLAKYTQAAGVLIFGENSFGWRISSVIFGTMVIAMIALLANELFNDKSVSLLAALLASWDGLLLVQSRIAMNDIHVTFFILLTFLLYIKYRKHLSIQSHQQEFNLEKIGAYKLFPQSERNTHLFLLFLSGVAGGLAMASKWSGVFAVGILIFFEGVSLLKKIGIFTRHYLEQKNEPLKVKKSRTPTIGAALTEEKIPSIPSALFMTIFLNISKIAIYLVILPTLVYILSYVHMFMQGKSLVCEQDFVQQGSCYCEQTSSWWVEGLKAVAPQRSAEWEALEARGGCKRLVSHFTELHKEIWWYQTNLKATHDYQSRPWQWFLDVRPVWMYVHYTEDTITNIYAQGNPFLFWIGDVTVIITLVAVGFSFFKKNKSLDLMTKNNKLLPTQHYIPHLNSLFFTLVAYLLLWAPWQASPRIMFFYHYTPAVPMLCIILAYWLVKMQSMSLRISVIGYEVRIERIFLWTTLLLIGLTFIVFYPNWTGIPVPTSFAQRVYYFIPSWR